MSQTKTRRAISAIAIWKSVVDLVLSKPKILFPFLWLAGCEVIVLYLLACSPHVPVNWIMAAPIRRIWGEIYLHYPFNYEILPRLFYYAKVLLGIFVGSITGGMAVVITANLKNREPVVLGKIFRQVFKHYISLFLLVCLLFVFVHFLLKEPGELLAKYFRGHPKLLFVGPKLWFAVALPVINFVSAVLLQTLFVYTIPYIVLKGRKFLGALVGGIVLSFRRIVKTFLIVLLPMILYIPNQMLSGSTGVVVDKLGPESVIGILLIGVLFGTVIVDAFVTIATTLLFIEATDEK
jgi:hypothetical protein